MLTSFFLDVGRLALWFFLLLFVLAPLERLRPATPRPRRRSGWGTDIGFYLLNGLATRALLALVTAAVAWTLHALVPSAVLSWGSRLSLGPRLAFALVVGELGFYWGHRWTHQVPWLWRFHEIHHSPRDVDWLVNTHAHPVDVMFVRLCGFVPMYALGLASPVAGTQIDVVPLLVLVIGTAWGFVIHANVRWGGGWLGWLVSTPQFHHWHHTRSEHVDRNFASMLPCVDALFGTLHLPKGVWPAAYGVTAPVPDGLAGQLLHPLRRHAPAAHFDATTASRSDTRTPSA